MVNLGIVKPGSTILIPFHTFDSNDPSASVTMTGLALADIGIYKGTSMTERASTTGVVLLDTDGIDIDSTTGIHGLSIDLSSNATADFYNVGSNYYVTIASITVDAATVNFVAATFTIGYPGAIQETNIATLASQTSFTLDEGSADDDAYNGCPVYVHDIASDIQVAFGYVSDYTGSTKTVTLAADPGIFTMAAGDNISFFPPSNVQAVAGTTQTAGDLAALVTTVDTVVDGIQTDLSNGTDGLGAIKTDTAAILVDTGTTLQAELDAIQAAVITNAAGVDIAADIIAVKAETALIVADTNELQTDNVPGLIATAQADLDIITGADGANLLSGTQASIDAIEVDTSTTLQAELDAIQAAVITNAAGVDIAADIIAVKAETASILTDTGTTLDTKINDLQGATFSSATDSNEAIRNRGDAAWTTGAGGSPPTTLQTTTIATLASQVSFTLTAGSSDDGAYIGCLAIIEDVSTAVQKAIGVISAYTGATKTVTLREDPAIFIMAATDNIDIVAISPDILNILADTATIGTPVGADISADIAAVKAETTLIVADTNELQGDWTNGGRLDLIIDAIAADTNELQTDDVPGLIAALENIAASDVLTQVNAALDTAIAELGVAAPTATPTIRTGLMLLYMALRDKVVVQTSGIDALEIHNDAGTKIASKLITDDGADYTEAKMS